MGGNWYYSLQGCGEGEGFVAPGIFSPPSLCPALPSGGQRTLCYPHYGCLTLGAPPRPLPYLPKAPLRCWERVPGLQNWKHRPQNEEGKDGAISKSLLSLAGGCDNLCLALFISRLSPRVRSVPIADISASLFPAVVAAGIINKSSLLVSLVGNIYPKSES